jgi:uncharacterized protein (TIGR00730 family)
VVKTARKPPQKSVAVFCSASDGANRAYRAAAESLGRTLAQHGLGLIYGGGNTGLMGAVADGALTAGGHVVGVIPHALAELEVAHQGLTELHLTDTMHTRKAMMAARADAFFVLPGGFGTLEEMFEVLAWQTLKLHAKPVVLLNIAGFFDTLLGFLDVCDREGMLRSNRGILLVAQTPEEALRLAGLME